jgi:hypothetical protein
MNDHLVLEIALVKLKAGVTDEALIHAVNDMQPDLEALPGYVRRELLKNDEGQWVDMIYWRSNDEAMKAMEVAMTIPSFLQCFSLLDESTLQMLHLSQVATLHPVTTS